jgi:hypothetical protein
MDGGLTLDHSISNRPTTAMFLLKQMSWIDPFALQQPAVHGDPITAALPSDLTLHPEPKTLKKLAGSLERHRPKNSFPEWGQT